jgi:hypothetical protein
MSRIISRAATGSCLILAAFSFVLPAAEKTPKPDPAETMAREEVLAALRAEAAGDNERRAELLARAAATAPDLAEANWHLARVRANNAWKPVGEHVAQAVADASLAKYREIRDKASDNPQALENLARWCLRAGLADRARLHFAKLLAHPHSDLNAKKEAVKQLDLVPIAGGWATREEIAARSAAEKSMQSALAKWAPQLRKLQLVIDSDDFERRDKSIADFHKLDDPAIIVVLEAFISEGGDRFQEEAIKRLASFPHYEATVALVRYAVLSPYALARRAAAEALRDRPRHEFVPLLVGALQSPLKSQFQVRWDPSGRLVYDRAVLQEGTTGNLLLLTHQLSVPNFVTSTTAKTTTKFVPRSQPESKKVDVTVRGLSPVEAFAAERQAVVTRALADQAAAELANSQMEAGNQRAFEALERSTGEQLPRVPADWWQWWQDYNQYAWPKPTYHMYQWSAQRYTAHQFVNVNTSGTQHAPAPRSGRPPAPGALNQQWRPIPSCFVAGTPIRTETGPLPVEAIRPGDRVLSQDQNTGELAYKVVLRTTVRPPSRLTHVYAGSERITTTLGHPFWVNGHGWKMAKELAAGDLLHSIGGAVRVEKVEPAGEDKAYNLVIDDFNTYFVGEAGLLVHDNEFRKPTRAIVPGLVEDAAVTVTK